MKETRRRNRRRPPGGAGQRLQFDWFRPREAARLDRRARVAERLAAGLGLVVRLGCLAVFLTSFGSVLLLVLLLVVLRVGDPSFAVWLADTAAQCFLASILLALACGLMADLAEAPGTRARRLRERARQLLEEHRRHHSE